MKIRSTHLIVPILAVFPIFAGCGMETEGADQHAAGAKSHTSAAAALASRLVDSPAPAVTDDQAAATATPSQADLLAPPPDQCNPDQRGQDVKDKTTEVVEGLCVLAALAAQDDLGIFAGQQVRKLNDACDRAKGWVNRTDKADFKAMGKKRRVSGQIMEYVGDDFPAHGHENDGNDDGVCEPCPQGFDCDHPTGQDPKKPKKQRNWEWCAEVIGDGIGDEDGFCEVFKEKQTSRKTIEIVEPCQEITSLDAVEDADTNFDCGTYDDVEAIYDDAATALARANAGLAERMELLRALRATTDETIEQANPSECLNLMYVDIDGGNLDGYQGVDRPHQYREMQEWNFSFLMLHMAADVCDDVAGADVFGFNALVACAPLRDVEGVIGGVAQAWELLDDAITATRLENTAKCLQYHHDYMKDGLTKVQNSLDFKVEFRRLHLQVIELKEKHEFLVGVTEAGLPDIVEGLTVRASKKHPVAFVEVEANWEELEPGLYLVTVDLPHALRNADLFIFEMWHTETYEDPDQGTQSIKHSGHALLDRSGQNTIGIGQ